MKRKGIKWLFMILVCFCGIWIGKQSVYAQTWYVSSQVSDPEGENDGLSEDAPFDHFCRLYGRAQEGDTILLEKGSVFRGEIFYPKEGMTIATYGEGKSPKIYGSLDNGADATKWTLYYQKDGMKIWKYYRQTCDVGVIHLGGKKYATRVYSYWNGKKAVCTMNINKAFKVKKELTYDLSFYQDYPKVITNCANDPEYGGMGALYLRCDSGNPGEVFSSIEFAEGVNKNYYAALIHCDGDNITIDGITCMYGNSMGISAGGNGNITIKNCTVGWVGGTPNSYNAGTSDQYGFVPASGEGIRLDGDYNTCKNCYVHDCFDGGILVETSDFNKYLTWHTTVQNNKVERCMNGIYFLVHLIDLKKFTQIATVKYNTIKDCGYGWTSDKNFYFTWGNSMDGGGINYYTTEENNKSKITLKGNKITHSKAMNIFNKKNMDKWMKKHELTSPNGCRF